MNYKAFLFAALLLTTAIVNAFEQNMGNMVCKTTAHSIIKVSCNKRVVGFIVPVPREDVGLIKITAEKDRFIIDTKEFYSKGGKKRNITFNIFGIDMKEVKLDNSNKIELDIKGQPEGIKARVYFEGKFGGKHYFRPKMFTLTGNWQTLAFSSKLPDNLENIHIRCDLKSSGVYTFNAARFNGPQE